MVKHNCDGRAFPLPMFSDKYCGIVGGSNGGEFETFKEDVLGWQFFGVDCSSELLSESPFDANRPFVFLFRLFRLSFDDSYSDSRLDVSSA